jgi:hypothetical protein
MAVAMIVWSGVLAILLASLFHLGVFAELREHWPGIFLNALLVGATFGFVLFVCAFFLEVVSEHGTPGDESRG